MRMIHCPNCGTENDSSEELCVVCGYDLSTITALICPICQFENNVDAKSCRQCGTQLVRIASAGDSDGKRGSGGSAVKSYRDISTPVGDESNNKDASITNGDDSDEELHDWLSELTAVNSIAGEGDDEPHSGTAPLWFKKSEQKLDQTSELAEETLPDWLKNLNVIEESPKPEERPVKKHRLPDWLKESGELDESRLPPPKLPEPLVEEPDIREEEPENGVPEAKKPDTWLIELAAMGTADLVEKEIDDETRFVWDDSALVSDVPADLGKETPGWLAELSQIKDMPDQLTDSVVSEWLDKQADIPKQPKEFKDTGTSPLGPTKELSGVPEQLVSPDLPEWLEDQTGETQAAQGIEEQDTQAEIELEAQFEEVLNLVDEEPVDSFDMFSDERDETDDETPEEKSDFPEETPEELAAFEEHLDEDLEEPDLPQRFGEDGTNEELAILLNYLEDIPHDDPSDGDDFYETEIEDTLELVIKDLPELMRKPEPSELPDISDEAKKLEISAQPAIEPAEDLAFQDDEDQHGGLIEEVTTSDLPSDVDSIAPVPTQEVPEMLEGDADISREEVPGWLGLLTGKLLDTFDNDFVSEWFTRGKEKEEIESIEEIEEAVPYEKISEADLEPEQPREIDPFYGEVIPEWVVDADPELIGEVDAPGARPSTIDIDTVSEDARDVASPAQGELEVGTEEVAEVAASNSADEWLDLLDSPEDETDLSQFLEAEALLELESETADTSDTVLSIETGPVSILFDEDEPIADLTDEFPVGPLIPLAFPAVEVQDFTITKEQKQQVALLQHLTSAEPKESRPIAGKIRTGTNPSFRLIVATVLLMLITLGWLIPTNTNILPDPVFAPISDAETGLNEAINDSAGEPVLVAFEYTPATAGEMDIVAKTLIQQIADNGSQVISVSQIAAGTVMADRIVSDIEGLESYDMGYLPGGPIGLRNLALCINGEGSCQSTFGQQQEGEVADNLAGVGLLLVLAADRDGLIDWIEQVGTQVDFDTAAGIIQPLEPVILPYLNSGQVAGAVVGAPSAAAYHNEFLNYDYEGFQFASLVMAQWFIIGVLIIGAIYFGVSGFWSSSNSGAEAQ